MRIRAPQKAVLVDVWWRTSDEHQGRELCSIVASLGCKTVGVSVALHQVLLNPSKGAVKRDSSHVSIEKLLKPEEFAKLEVHFEALVKRWITYSKAIGGLKKYLKC